MFHSLQSHEQYEVEDQYQISFTMSPWPPVDNIHQNLIVHNSNIFPVVAGAGGGEGLKKLGKRPISENQENKNDETKLQKKSKSLCEIERQRRKEMANLYASLRKLLPFEYIKGKRSTSDHMHEAVNYINNMQKNIIRLRLKNEMLTKNPKYSCTGGGAGVLGNANAESCSSRQRRSSTVTAYLCQNGVEILISNFTPKEEVFRISRILKKLLILDLDVISCMSTSSNDGSTLYKIISEVDDPSCINIIGLQKTLTDTITQYTT